MNYENPPIIELIVEIRWQYRPPTEAAGASGNSTLAVGHFGIATSQEEFFMRFNREISRDSSGFQVERLVPQGFPLLPSQPVYRFREPSSDAAWKRLYQLGPGIFSAHALPPNYQSWEQFRPFVRAGVLALVKSRNEFERKDGFSTVILRYLDAFDSKLTGNRTARGFCEDVLGFRVQPPAVLVKHAKDIADVVPTIQLAVPLKTGENLYVTVSPTDTSGDRKILMDTMVATNSPVKAGDTETVDAIMESLDRCHVLTNDIFESVTDKIRPEMRPAIGGVS